MSSAESILPHLPVAFLMFVRLGGLMIYGPIFGSSVIPVRVKVFLSLTLVMALYPVLAARMTPMTLELSLWTLGPIVILEVLIGLAIGFMASIPLVAVQTGGLVMGQQMGLGFAQLFNPTIDDEADVVGQMLFLMALGGFVLVGGHESLVLAVLHSFEHIPIGSSVADADLIALLTGLLLAALELALRVAAPLLALIFLESLAMGFIAKTVPQLNILSLGFPLRILIGMLIIAVGLVVIDEVVMDGVDETLALIFDWVEQ